MSQPSASTFQHTRLRPQSTRHLGGATCPPHADRTHRTAATLDSLDWGRKGHVGRAYQCTAGTSDAATASELVSTAPTLAPSSRSRATPPSSTSISSSRSLRHCAHRCCGVCLPVHSQGVPSTLPQPQLIPPPHTHTRAHLTNDINARMSSTTRSMEWRRSPYAGDMRRVE
jgi:hypothetical protein